MLRVPLILVVMVAVVACPRLSAEEVPLEQLLIQARTSTGTDLSHIDGAVFQRGDHPICAFGVVKLPDEKPHYAYFVLFKPLAKGADSCRVSGGGSSETNQLKYRVDFAIGKRNFSISHEYAIDDDTKKPITDKLQIGDKAIKAGEPRFFVVDLACDPPSVTAVERKLPEVVLDPADDAHHLATIKQISQSLSEAKDLAELLR